ncbi:hypothetical protein HS088_TW15G00646 [Tripterygium wilfordii]|uniref:RING-type domain-containing protein n=1 Tax=Tripterygium wilfordii TaxID=458696 RepID=A0A7J7CMK6_TRIWF|nr:uncharacterized protein LOC120016221 [Tripterygium wilfordii]KAF5735146.1 hypothetical protein HS088_TW15G00646 [Tripterygium wilfordii]
MGSGGSKVRHGGGASSSSSSGRRDILKGSRIFQSSCLGVPSGSRDSDNEDQVFDYGNKETAGNALCEEQTDSDLGQGEIECFTKEKAEHSDRRSCISSNVDLDQWVQPSISNTSSRNGSNSVQASSTHSLNPPSRFLSRFTFIPGNVSFRLSRTTSLRSSGSCPVPDTSLSMLNGGEEVCQCSGSDNLDRNEAQQITDLLPPSFNNRDPTHYHENNSHSLHLNGPVSDVLDNIQGNQTISSIQEVMGNGCSDIVGASISLHSPRFISDLNGIETRLSDRRIGARQPVERNVHFSRTLSVGRLRDRVLRRSSLSDLTSCPLEQSRDMRDASQGTRRQALGGDETALSTSNVMSPYISDYHPSNISNSTFSTQDNELQTSRSREARYHDLLEHRSNFLERRRRIQSQVRALQRLGSRFENLSGHERSCILSGQNRTGHCTCRVSNRTGNLNNDDTGARASISRIVMLAEALFEVLDEIHQQSVVLSTRPPVSSIGSVPAPNEVVESLPIKLYTKLQKYQLEETAQCYICLVDYEEGDSLRILPCNHEFHGACIDKWLKEIHRVCPLCRGDICKSESPSAVD